MQLVYYFLHLLLWYIKYGAGNLIEDYEEMTKHDIISQDQKNLVLPVELGKDKSSGCICRATKALDIVVCFGNYECKHFPKVTVNCEILRVRTTVIEVIHRGALDRYHQLTVLDIEANHQLKHIEPGVFRNLTKLQHLSISYNTALMSIDENLFQGLINLRNLTLVNNRFTNIQHLTPAFRPSILPSLDSLDLSENTYEQITEHTFFPMTGTTLNKLDINLCRLDYVHPDGFKPLKFLKHLNVGENDLNVTIIGDFLIHSKRAGINLTRIDLSGMGFRKQPPKKLLEIIAQTTIKWILLAENQFEALYDDSFPEMPNIELIDLRRVYAMIVGGYTFDPIKFPNLKVLLLGGNNLPGIHQKHLSDQLLVLDLSNNKGNPINPVYYEIDKDTFVQSTELRILNLSYNRIKSIYDYTFRGLEKLKVLNMENGTIFFIGEGTFKATKRLEILNFANNPLTANQNLTFAQFEGLNKLLVLILTNCGIRRFYDDDNIFETMPSLTHLILKKNLLYYLTAETLKPLKNLQVLDLSENLLIAWWKPLFLASGVRPHQIYLRNNKISHFTASMIQDISYLLENNTTESIEIDLKDNVFVCDCNSMHKTYLWLEVNGSLSLKHYFGASNFHCSSPDLWEDRRIAEYLSSVKSLHCLMYEKISSFMVIAWTAPSLVTITLVVVIVIIMYKYRIYIRYWVFLAKMALGRKFIRSTVINDNRVKDYKYDAFISYCFDDRDFVLEMISNLENIPPYLKLCVSERDFEIGAFISEAILTSINESRFVILLISNNFAKSQWCRWETQLAEYHRLFLEDGTSYDPLVLVRIGDVENKYLTPTLKFLLKTKIYLSWEENYSEEFWKKLRNVLSRKKVP